MAKSKEINTDIGYDAAMAELKIILDDLLDENTSIDQLYGKVARAKELVTLCQQKLRGVENMLKD